MTVTGSLFAFGGWCAAFVLTLYLRWLPLPELVFVGLVTAASVLVAGVFTNLGSRPFEPVFRMAHARERSSLVGESCEIATGRVDGRFGQATAMLGGDDLLFQVRCDSANTMSRGDKALIVSFDAERDAFVVESLSAPGRQSSLATARRASPRAVEEG